MRSSSASGSKTSFPTSAAAVFLLALAVRLAFAFPGLVSDDERFLRPDSGSYLASANSLYHYGEYRNSEGEPTAFRTPGLSVFLACFKPAAGNGTALYSFLLLLIGSLTVFPIYASCRRFAPPGASAFASLLFCLNPTAISAAPMLLSDTLFLFFTAFTLYFFLLGMEKKDAFYFLSAVFCAGIGTLVRPVNLFWLVPCLIALFLTDQTWKRKWILGGCAVLLFALPVFPWIVRNHAAGEGWRLDTSSVSTLQHNASTLESSITGEPAEQIRERYREEFAALPWLYRTKAEQNTVIEQKMIRYILSHPVRYVQLSVRPYVYLPDIPTLLENLNVTQTGQGTFDVLNRHGLLAAAEHYFASAGWWLMITLPLTLATLLLYCSAIAGWIRTLLKKEWCLAFLLFGFGFYYTLMTGPVQMPRYTLPALPVFCLFAALAWKKPDKKR